MLPRKIKEMRANESHWDGISDSRFVMKMDESQRDAISDSRCNVKSCESHRDGILDSKWTINMDESQRDDIFDTRLYLKYRPEGTRGALGRGVLSEMASRWDSLRHANPDLGWIPASAGMTKLEACLPSSAGMTKLEAGLTSSAGMTRQYLGEIR